MFRYDRLDELILETGKKKKYLSIKMGHSARYLNDAKKQNTNIKDSDVEILATELNTTREYLQGETDIKEKPTTQTGEGLYPTDFFKLTPENKAFINRQIELLIAMQSDQE